MTSQMELHLQQCRIFQNKDKAPVAITYANDDKFYKNLDHYVFEGHKLDVTFSPEKLTENSALLERILSCFNGQNLISDCESYFADMQAILAFSSPQQFKDTLDRCLLSHHKIYHTYKFTYEATEDKKNILRIAPAGEGFPSQSFTVDLS